MSSIRSSSDSSSAGCPTSVRQSSETGAIIVFLLSLHFIAISGEPAGAKLCFWPCLDDAHMCMSVCAVRYAMLMAAGEYGFDSKADAR